MQVSQHSHKSFYLQSAKKHSKFRTCQTSLVNSLRKKTVVPLLNFHLSKKFAKTFFYENEVSSFSWNTWWRLEIKVRTDCDQSNSFLITWLPESGYFFFSFRTTNRGRGGSPGILKQNFKWEICGWCDGFIKNGVIPKVGKWLVSKLAFTNYEHFYKKSQISRNHLKLRNLYLLGWFRA